MSDRRAAIAISVTSAALSIALVACGSHSLASPKADQNFLNSVYSQAPDVGSYRTASQLVSLGQTVCADLRAGASVQQLGDRLPLGEGSVALPPADLGVVISSAVTIFCPNFAKLLGT